VNGCSGIGTGWSTELPCFNPCDIIRAIKLNLKGGEMDLIPWYRGFSGTIVKLTETSFLTKGCYEIHNNNKLVVTELPIGIWTDKYKEYLETITIDTKIKSNKQIIRSYNTYCTDVKVHFEIMCGSDVLHNLNVYDEKIHMTKLEKVFKLGSLLNISNMVLYDPNSKIKKYNNVSEIITDYSKKRLSVYDERIKYIINGLKKELDILKYKALFIKEFIENTIKVIKTKKEVIIEQLKTKEYPEVNNNYDYLLKMPIYNLTQDKIDEFNNKLKNKEEELDKLNITNNTEMWNNELNDLEEYMKKNNYNCLVKTIKKKLIKKKKVN
jgi:DNA topoisomerase-2